MTIEKRVLNVQGLDIPYAEIRGRGDGRITAVPIVNVAAFWAPSPIVVPADGRNLNRSLPGDPDGTAADQPGRVR
ncbi:MAG TPA: hypothetical protein VGL93_19670 [Streptosporangiaceae bacterium]|jgi:hypothetical protein